MNQRTRLLRILFPLALLILGCPSSTPPDAPPPPTGITVLGQTAHLTPGAPVNLLVQVKNPYTQMPRANTAVQVLLSSPNNEIEPLFAGETDASGLLAVQFDAPAAPALPDQRLVIVADTDDDLYQLQQAVYIGRVYNILVSTDKPVYQPGQVIHMRGLALDAAALTAAESQPLTLTVQDPAGNRVMQQVLTTSTYGVAAADFVLDAQATTGDYLITAAMGPVVSTRTVEVKPYTLPRFAVTLQSDRAFYLPGETATGTVDAHYFFGKPVAGARVTIQGFVTDVVRTLAFELTGMADDEGRFHYTFQVPDYFVGQLDNRRAEVELEIAVVDTADHAERIDERITIAEQLILVEAAPESGLLRPGVENIIYLHTEYPDGRDAPTALTVVTSLNTTTTVQTDAYGLAVITVTPTDAPLTLDIRALDAAGEEVMQQLTLASGDARDVLLLRPDRAEYQVGETIHLDFFVTSAGEQPPSTVYLDIVKGRQTYALMALPVSDGKAQTAIDIDGSLLGTVELNAYAIGAQGEIGRDRRLVLVNPAPAQVTVTADAGEYRPGDTARLEIAVARNGAPMPGVVGVSIVDESVFALGTQAPGFARTYFLLERDLQEPRYEIRGFTPLGDEDPSPYDKGDDDLNASVQAEPAQLALFGLFGETLRAAVQDEAAAQWGQSAGRRITSLWDWPVRVGLLLPLMGLVLYDGTRRRRHWLAGLLLLGLGAVGFAACSAAPAAAPAADATATQGQAAATTRLRQYFPETLYWLPEAPTDAAGRVVFDVPMADSITTWRVSVLASDQAGNLGSAEVGLRVFQPFFIEPDLPRFLTVGDELDVPVSLFNYTDEPQVLTLTVAEAGWFNLGDDAIRTVQLGPNEVSVVYIPLQVTQFGNHQLQITAQGDSHRDAVLRPVEVLPDGEPMVAAQSGVLTDAQTLNFFVPEAAIPGASRLTVKLYPGMASQVVDGLDGLLRLPYGCFEQTSSVTYPNVMVLDYLRRTGQANPRIQFQAEQYINLGYQRLLRFEVDGVPGGFSLYGDPPPWTMLTAYGLMQFSDMSRVSYVDPALLERTAYFLMDRQQADGSWPWRDDGSELDAAQQAQRTLIATAYTSWALADAGYADSEAVQRGLLFVQTTLDEHRVRQMLGGPGQRATPVTAQMAATFGINEGLDTYTLATAANALVAAGVSADKLLDQLATSVIHRDDQVAYWGFNQATWMGSGGRAADLETTALATIALLRAGRHSDVAAAAVRFISSQRDGFGSFHTTQATVLALKALLLAAERQDETAPATITVTLNGGRTQTVVMDETSAGVVQLLHFDDLAAGEHSLRIDMTGERTVNYQVVTTHYAPWTEATNTVHLDAPLRIDVQYDRTELQVNDTARMQAEVVLLADGVAGTLIVDLGIPPGFSPITADLDALVSTGRIDRYDLTGRQVILYLSDVRPGDVLAFDYRLLARFPIRAQTPSSRVYDYYTPERQASTPPTPLHVARP